MHMRECCHHSNKTACLKHLLALAVIVGTSLALRGAVSEAGDINGNEARVIGVASGSFEYDGEIYVARQSYVNQLSGYLSKDGVDLTSSQADKAISKIYASVATGVKQGYIVKASSESDNSSKDKQSEGDNSSKDKQEDKSNQDREAENDAKEPVTTPSDAEADNNAVAAAASVVENDNGSVEVQDTNGNTVASLDGTLRNTGYSLYNTIIVIGVIAMIFLLTVVYSIYTIYSSHRIAKNDAVRS